MLGLPLERRGLEILTLGDLGIAGVELRGEKIAVREAHEAGGRRNCEHRRVFCRVAGSEQPGGSRERGELQRQHRPRATEHVPENSVAQQEERNQARDGEQDRLRARSGLGLLEAHDTGKKHGRERGEDVIERGDHEPNGEGQRREQDPLAPARRVPVLREREEGRIEHGEENGRVGRGGEIGEAARGLFIGHGLTITRRVGRMVGAALHEIERAVRVRSGPGLASITSK